MAEEAEIGDRRPRRTNNNIVCLLFLLHFVAFCQSAEEELVMVICRKTLTFPPFEYTTSG